MTSENSTLREVDQELAEARQQEMLRRFLPFLIGGAVLIVIGVGGWQFYTQQKQAKAERGALIYNEALESLEEDPATGRQQLADIAEGEASGYAALASFQRAALLAEGGDTVQAYALYKSIANNAGITSHMQDLARVRAAYLSLDSGGRDAVIDDLGTLPEKDTPFGLYARELLALADLAEKDYDQAIAKFEALADAPQIPPSLRARVEQFAVLASAGKSGANITGEARVEDLLDRLGETPALEIPEEAAAGVGEEEGVEASTADIPAPEAPASEPDGTTPVEGAPDGTTSEKTPEEVPPQEPQD